MSPILKQQRYEIKGSGLKATTLQALLEATYSGNEVEGFVLDKEISTKESRVFVNPSGHIVVAHIGSYNTADWMNNAVYAVGGDFAYKQTPRFKRAEQVQKKAEAKYNPKNISVISHSQSGIIAQLLGKNVYETITVNKATRPQDLFRFNQSKNQYDVRSEADIVSLWRNPLQKRNETTIKKNSNNIISEHKPEILNRLGDKIIGKTTGYVS